MRWVALVWLLLAAPSAWAQCSGPAGIPFNCTAGGTPQSTDLVLGGSVGGANTVKWTWGQVFTAFGGSVTWPTAGDVVISNGTSSPGGVAPSGTNCLVSSGGSWTTGGCGGGGGSTMTGSTNGIGRPDSLSTVVSGAGIFSVTDTVQAPRTSAITFVASDMSTLIPANTGVSGITISPTNFASTVFGIGQTSCVENNTAGALPITNSSTHSMFPAFSSVQIGETICLTGNGTDMFATVTKAPVSNVASGGTGLSSLPSGAIPRGAGTNPLAPSNLSDNGTLVSAAVATVATPVALTDGATIAVNAALSDNFTLTLTGSHTLLNPTNMTAGQNITFQITQDGTGGRAITWGGDFSWMSGAPPLLNSAAAAVTFISCKVLSSASLYCAGGAPVPAYQTFACAVPHTTSTGATTLTCFWKAPRAFTVDNVTATVLGTFTTVTATLLECGASTTCASSPVTMTTGAVTGANTATPLTVASPTINTGDYIAIELTAGTVTAIDVNVQAVMH